MTDFMDSYKTLKSREIFHKTSEELTGYYASYRFSQSEKPYILTTTKKFTFETLPLRTTNSCILPSYIYVESAFGIMQLRYTQKEQTSKRVFVAASACL